MSACHIPGVGGGGGGGIFFFVVCKIPADLALTDSLHHVRPEKAARMGAEPATFHTLPERLGTTQRCSKMADNFMVVFLRMLQTPPTVPGLSTCCLTYGKLQTNPFVYATGRPFLSS